jgi:hypothetical protein
MNKHMVIFMKRKPYILTKRLLSRLINLNKDFCLYCNKQLKIGDKVISQKPKGKVKSVYHYPKCYEKCYPVNQELTVFPLGLTVKGRHM